MDMERSLRVWASSELAAVSDPEESGSASPEQRLLIESRRSARWASIAQDDLALVVFDWRTTPRQIALVAESLESLDLDALADQFYRRVFAGGPALAAMFTSDPAVQRGRFTTELAALVGSIQRLDTFCSSAHALGARHRDFGAPCRALPRDGSGVAVDVGRGARFALDRRRRGGVDAVLQPHGGDDDDGRAAAATAELTPIGSNAAAS
jgi:hypothetical protein